MAKANCPIFNKQTGKETMVTMAMYKCMLGIESTLNIKYYGETFEDALKFISDHKEESEKKAKKSGRSSNYYGGGYDFDGTWADGMQFEDPRF